MARYSYKALSKNGSLVQGVMEGESEKEILNRIQGDSLVPVEVKLQTKVKKSLDLSRFKLSLFERDVSEKDIFWFTQQFARLLSSGFTADHSLQVISRQNKKPGLARILQRIRIMIQEGKSLSECMREFPAHFSLFYVHMVEAGELGGILPDAMKQVENFKAKQERLKRKLTSSLAYPTIMIATLFFTGLVFVFFIIPEFAAMYEEMNRELPLITQIVVFISDAFLEHGLLILIAVVLALGGVQLWAQQNQGALWDQLSVASLRITDLYTEIISERFCRVMGSLLESGVQVYPALEIVKKTIDNHFVREHLSNVQIGVQKGQSMASLLSQDHLFSEILIQGVDLGEENGKMGEILSQIADQFEESINSKVEIFLAIIEPLMTLIVAIFVVLMILAMVLPMKQSTNMI